MQVTQSKYSGVIQVISITILTFRWIQMEIIQPHTHTLQIALLTQLILSWDKKKRRSVLLDSFETNTKLYTEAAEEWGGQWHIAASAVWCCSLDPGSHFTFALEPVFWMPFLGFKSLSKFLQIPRGPADKVISVKCGACVVGAYIVTQHWSGRFVRTNFAVIIKIHFEFNVRADRSYSFSALAHAENVHVIIMAIWTFLLQLRGPSPTSVVLRMYIVN